MTEKKYYLEESKIKKLLEINQNTIGELDKTLKEKTNELEQLQYEVDNLNTEWEQRNSTIYDCQKVLKRFDVIKEKKLFKRNGKTVETKNIFTRNREIFIEFEEDGVLLEMPMSRYLRIDEGFTKIEENSEGSKNV